MSEDTQPEKLNITDAGVELGDTSVAVEKLKKLAEQGDPHSLLLYVQLRQLLDVEKGLNNLAGAMQQFAIAFARMQMKSEEAAAQANDPAHMVKHFMSTVAAIKELGGMDFRGLFGENKKTE